MPYALKMNDDRLGCVIFRSFFGQPMKSKLIQTRLGKVNRSGDFVVSLLNPDLKNSRNHCVKHASSMSAMGRLAPPGDLCVRLLSHLQRVVDFDP